MHARESRKICPGDRHQYSSDGKIAGLYDLDRTIGKGHFAVVKLARHVFTGEQVNILYHYKFKSVSFPYECSQASPVEYYF